MSATATFDPSRNLKLYIRLAMDGVKTITFSDSAGNPKNISGLTFEMVIYQRVGGQALFTWTESNQLSKPDNYSLNITITDTIASQFQARDYFYIIKRTDVSLVTKTWFNGKLIAHEGEFDGVNNESEFTINDVGEVINVTISDGGSGAGTVTSFSSGNLSPLFIISVDTPTTTPALSFTAVNQNANLVYAGPATGAAATPTFRALVRADLPITGTPDGTKFLKDDLTWSVIPSSGVSGLTATRVPFAQNSTTLIDSSNFTFDSANSALSVNGIRISNQSSSAASAGRGLYIGENAGVLTSFTIARLENIGIGTNVLSNITDTGQFHGSYNTGVGIDALRFSTQARYNSAYGFHAMRDNVTGIQSAAFGYFSQKYFTGSGGNTSFGYLALQGQSGLSTGTENTAFGRTALSLLTTGVRNVAMGPCLQALTTGNYNVVGGSESYERLTTQSENTGWGHWTGVYNRGSGNSSFGAFAFAQTTTDSATNDASYNCIFGNQAGRFLVRGNYNIFIGYDSGTSAVGEIYSNTAAIGKGAKVTASNSFVLGGVIDGNANNYGFGGESFGSGSRVTYFKKSVTNPSGAPTDGFILYGDSTTGDAYIWNAADGASFKIGAGGSGWAVTGNTTLTGAATIIGTSTNTQTHQFNALGSTPTDVWLLTNDTDASVGVQQYSPFILQRARGWKTNATAASQTVDFDFGVTATQGSANPTGNWLLRTSVNGAAYTTAINVYSELNNFGIKFLNNTATLLGTTNNIFSLSGNGRINIAGASSSGSIQYNITSVIPSSNYAIGIFNINANITATSGTISELKIGSGFAPSSGTTVYNMILANQTINNAGSGVATIFNISPTWTSTGGDAFFLDYNPTVVSITGIHYAARFVSGSVLIGGTTLTTDAMLDLQSTTKAFIPPRMTTAQRDAIGTPSAGMVVYNTSTNKLNVYTTAWEQVTSA